MRLEKLNTTRLDEEVYVIRFTQKGDFSTTIRYLTKVKNKNYRPILEKYGMEGVKALSMATPKDTGLTADSWRYEIETSPNGISIFWLNTHMVGGVPLVILLQYGHGTRSGSFVQGIDFINPAMRPIFDRIAENLVKEVSSL